VLSREDRWCSLSLSDTKSSEYVSGYLSVSHTKPVESTASVQTLMLAGAILKAFTCNKITKAPLYLRESAMNSSLVSNTGTFIPKTYCSKCNSWQFTAVSFPTISYNPCSSYSICNPTKISYSERYVQAGIV